MVTEKQIVPEGNDDAKANYRLIEEYSKQLWKTPPIKFKRNPKGICYESGRQLLRALGGEMTYNNDLVFCEVSADNNFKQSLWLCAGCKETLESLQIQCTPVKEN